MDCICAARSEGECGCPGVDWTPSEVHDLRAMLKEARESLAFRRDLYRRQRKLMLQIMAERDELAGYLCRIKLPLPVRFVADLAKLFPGKNVRMKEVGGYLCIFPENV